MKTLKASQTRIPAEVFRRVVDRGERVRIRHRSSGTAVLVSESDIKLIEQAEDLLDAVDAEKASREFIESGEVATPYESIREKLLRTGDP